MALISRNIPGFYNGVNQQPVSIRLDTQVEIQENAYSSLVDGLIKRQNTDHLAVLTSNAKATSFVHTINRDDAEKYVMIFTDDASEPIEIYTITGTKCTIRYGILDDSLNFTSDVTVKDYIKSTEPFKNIRCNTISDYTLVTNRAVTCAMTADVSGGSIAGRVQTFNKLPLSAAGAIYEVLGDSTNAFDNYWMKSLGGDTWAETMQPGVKYKFDVKTLPHKLVRTALNEFTFSSIAYTERKVGDDDSVAIPSFIGGPVNNIFYYKGRLGFLSNERVILSRTNDYFNFWPSTVTDVLDDEPVDVDVSSTLPNAVINLLEYAPFNSNLILISPQQQFSLDSGGSILTPTSVSCTPVTTFEFNKHSTVCVAGTNVLFACSSGQHTGIREYYVQPDSLLNDAADITSHVPNYIPNGSIQLEVCNALDAMFVQSSSEVNAVYVYKYYLKDTEKAQSSWSKWVFDGEVIGLSVLETVLYVVIKRNNQVCLEKIELKRMNTDSLSFRLHIDRLCKLTGSYNSSTDETTWTLPYAESKEIRLIDKDSGQLLLNLVKVDDTHVKVKGNFASKYYCAGIDYVMKVRLNELYLKDVNTRVPYLDGVIKVRNITFNFSNTGYFRVEVQAKSREVVKQPFTGVSIGSSLIGTPSILTGKKRFFVLANSSGTSIDIINDSYLPCSFQTGSFEAEYNARAKG